MAPRRKWGRQGRSASISTAPTPQCSKAPWTRWLGRPRAGHRHRPSPALNLGSQPVDATLGLIAHTLWTWDERSLHFRANWRQQTGIETRLAEGTTDWNYLTATGRGIYVGDTLALQNGSGPWWGEGDEKAQAQWEWSNGRQLWWRDGRPGHRLELLLPSLPPGHYEGRRGQCVKWLNLSWT